MPEPTSCAIAQGPSVPWPLWVLQTHLCTGMWRVHLLIHSSEQPWADGHAEPCSVTGPSAGFAICNLSAQSFLASLKSHLEDRPWGPHSPHGPHGSHRPLRPHRPHRPHGPHRAYGLHSPHVPHGPRGPHGPRNLHGSHRPYGPHGPHGSQGTHMDNKEPTWTTWTTWTTRTTQTTWSIFYPRYGLSSPLVPPRAHQHKLLLAYGLSWPGSKHNDLIQGLH